MRVHSRLTVNGNMMYTYEVAINMIDDAMVVAANHAREREMKIMSVQSRRMPDGRHAELYVNMRPKDGSEIRVSHGWR